jgi:Amt family ammonium transporter
MLTATVLVLFMVLPGLFLLNGASRSTDEIFVSGILIFISIAITTVIWGVYGYSLAFGNGLDLNQFLGSFDHMFLSNIRKDEYIGSIPIFVYAIFQLSFAIVTVALLCGAFDRNVNLVVFFLFVVLWVSLVYIPIAHWVWGGGFLAQLQFLDFAGGTVVHLSSGVSAAVLIARRGPVAASTNGPISNIQVLSLFMGASFLWLGWFGFNAGSALAADETAAVAFITTLFAAAAAALVWFFFENLVYGYLRAPSMMTGALAGLVAITPASGFVQVGPALLIGAVAGGACFVVSWAVRDALKLDDPTDLISVHAAGGAIGTILTGIFATKRIGTGEGWIDGNFNQVILQIAAVVVVVAWCIVVTYILISVLEAIFSRTKRRSQLLTAAPKI